MKAPPGDSNKDPQGLKTQEGIGLLAELIPLLVVTDCYQAQGLGGEGVRVGIVGFGRRETETLKRHEGTVLRRGASAW